MSNINSDSQLHSAACSPEGQTGSFFTSGPAVSQSNPNNPYANLPDWSATDRYMKEKLRAEDVFQDKIVFYLLKHYGLDKKRAMFILRNYALEAWNNSWLLKLLDFKRLFPYYPITLHFKMLSKYHTRRITVQNLFNNIHKTQFMTEIESMIDHLGGRSKHERQTIPLGCVLGWPNVFAAESLVLHNLLPVNSNVIGSHLLIHVGEGLSFMLEPLRVFLEGVDSRFPKKNWMATASDPDFFLDVQRSTATAAD